MYVNRRPCSDKRIVPEQTGALFHSARHTLPVGSTPGYRTAQYDPDPYCHFCPEWARIAHAAELHECSSAGHV